MKTRTIVVFLLISIFLISFASIIIIDKSEEEISLHEKILEKFGDVGYEKGILSENEKIVEFSGTLKEYCEGGNC